APPSSPAHTLSLHDALPIYPALLDEPGPRRGRDHRGVARVGREVEPERVGRVEQVAGPQAERLAAQPLTPDRLVPQHDPQPAPVGLLALPVPGDDADEQVVGATGDGEGVARGRQHLLLSAIEETTAHAVEVLRRRAG